MSWKDKASGVVQAKSEKRSMCGCSIELEFGGGVLDLLILKCQEDYPNIRTSCDKPDYQDCRIGKINAMLVKGDRCCSARIATKKISWNEKDARLVFLSTHCHSLQCLPGPETR